MELGSDLILGVCACLAGALVQSATGFGFGLAAAPLLVATAGARPAVGVILVLGAFVNVLTLVSEGRRPHPRPDAWALLTWSLPGVALGAVALATLPESGIEAAIGLGILLGLGMHVRRTIGRRGSERPAPEPVHVLGHALRAPRVALAGSSAGLMNAATGLSAPPLVFHLLRAGASPLAMRDTLAVVFLGMSLASTGAAALTGALELPPGAAWFVLAVIAGHLLGRTAFARMGADAHERAVLAVLAAAAIASLASSFI